MCQIPVISCYGWFPWLCVLRNVHH